MGKQSWPQIWANYNIAKGNLWPLVLGWIAVMPRLLLSIKGARQQIAIKQLIL